MPSSAKKQAVSRRNGRQSNGPVSPAGKAISSQNARSHGILSVALLLPGEQKEDFDTLFCELSRELGAVGTLEQALVERIVISLWRQRRLIRAESAQIQLQQQGVAIAAASVPPRYQSDEALISASIEHMATALQLDALDQELASALASMPGAQGQQFSFPLLSRLFGIAKDDAKASIAEDYRRLLEQVALHHQLIASTIARCRLGSTRASLQADSLSVPEAKDALSRCQSALDNELYKALRALREAQASRRRQLDVGASRIEDSAS
jgi:hypothetical protein